MLTVFVKVKKRHFLQNISPSLLAFLSILATATIVLCYTQPLIHNTTSRKNDFIDPEIWMDTAEIINYHGYPAEEHLVTTADGYILTIHRIPSGKKPYHGKKRRPILLQHGILASSIGWVLNIPQHNFAYKLADAGFDVWLSNVRGNTYGKQHRELSVWNSEFWRFSFHEMGTDDIPAVIDYILSNTTFKQLDYIGYSMGSMILFVTLSTKPEYNAKIRSAVLLGPASNIHHQFSPLRYAQFLKPLLNFCVNCELAPFFPLLRYLNSRASQLCVTTPQTSTESCLIGKFIMGGVGDPDTQFNTSRLPVINAHFPDSTSVRTLLHSLQLKHNPFQMYDHGKCENQKIYGQLRPPVYNFTDIKIPISLFWSESDPVVSPLDVTILITKLPTLVMDYKIPAEKFSHEDYMHGLDANRLVYDKALEILKGNEI